MSADASISSLMLQLSAQMMPLLRALHDQRRTLRCLDTEEVPLEGNLQPSAAAGAAAIYGVLAGNPSALS